MSVLRAVPPTVEMETIVDVRKVVVDVDTLVDTLQMDLDWTGL